MKKILIILFVFIGLILSVNFFTNKTIKSQIEAVKLSGIELNITKKEGFFKKTNHFVMKIIDAKVLFQTFYAQTENIDENTANIIKAYISNIDEKILKEFEKIKFNGSFSHSINPLSDIQIKLILSDYEGEKSEFFKQILEKKLLSFLFLVDKKGTIKQYKWIDFKDALENLQIEFSGIKLKNANKTKNILTLNKIALKENSSEFGVENLKINYDYKNEFNQQFDLNFQNLNLHSNDIYAKINSIQGHQLVKNENEKINFKTKNKTDNIELKIANNLKFLMQKMSFDLNINNIDKKIYKELNKITSDLALKRVLQDNLYASKMHLMLLQNEQIMKTNELFKAGFDGDLSLKMDKINIANLPIKFVNLAITAKVLPTKNIETDLKNANIKANLKFDEEGYKNAKMIFQALNIADNFVVFENGEAKFNIVLENGTLKINNKQLF